MAAKHLFYRTMRDLTWVDLLQSKIDGKYDCQSWKLLQPVSNTVRCKNINDEKTAQCIDYYLRFIQAVFLDVKWYHRMMNVTRCSILGMLAKCREQIEKGVMECSEGKTKNKTSSELC